MNFASWHFFIFLAITLPLYWSMRSVAWQNRLLIGASYYFYACWDVRFLGLIVLSTVVSFLAAERLNRLDLDASQRRHTLQLFLAFSLGLLGLFKYFNFFADSFADLTAAFGWGINRVHLDIILPAAISFYTFESISHVVGAYKRELKVRATLLEYALFIAFFPKLVAGPIERPNVLQPQLNNSRRVTASDFAEGAFLVLLGLVKKVAVADGLAPVVASVFDTSADVGTRDVALASAAFALQIYGDFSGYSDIARGIALFFGIRLSRNFLFPYFSSNPSEFWRRWHISLSTWLRDYLYIPLGGNRSSGARTYRNLFLTMLIGGLWHGAAWTFVLWGAYQGLLLCVHRALRPVLALWGRATALVSPGLGSCINTAVFFVLTCYGWLLFRAVSFDQVAQFSQILLSWVPSRGLPPPPLSAMVGIPVILAFDWLAYRENDEAMVLRWKPWASAGLCAVLLVLTLMGMANSRAAFIYFQF
jgi:D-alanyl-lipoteichoic acid acyltransferase DltB (MBOAT superfamily)